jgi:holo-[acyl-carrier protein] synthase
VIVGTGVDIVDIRRIENSINRFSERFIRRILNDDEVRDSLEGKRLAGYVARQFAAKEAVSKALGTGMRSGVYFGNILVLRNEFGAPFVELRAGARARAQQIDATEIQVSLSDERDYAIAYAVAINS